MKLVLVRHGESVWNQKNIFTGWTDVELSEKGIEEARTAGKKLKEKNFNFDICYTSILKRAIGTMNYIFEEMNIKIPIYKTYKLNERHYGALQGFNKKEMAEKVGDDQVKLWRRSLKTRPPELELTDERHPTNNDIFKDIPKDELPSTESLYDTMQRVVEYYESEILPTMKDGKNIIVVAHGNSLRALVSYLEDLSEEEIINLNIPTGVPLVYEFDDSMNVINKYYLSWQIKA